MQLMIWVKKSSITVIQIHIYSFLRQHDRVLTFKALRVLVISLNSREKPHVVSSFNSHPLISCMFWEYQRSQWLWCYVKCVLFVFHVLYLDICLCWCYTWSCCDASQISDLIWPLKHYRIVSASALKWPLPPLSCRLLMPALQGFLMLLPSLQVVWRSLTDMFITPLFHSMGKGLSSVNVKTTEYWRPSAPPMERKYRIDCSQGKKSEQSF